MQEESRSASQEWVSDSFPRYQASTMGLRNYWYPVMLSSELRHDPKPVQVCGERIVVVRDRGEVYGLQDRCAHRGVPLSKGQCHYEGTLSCVYHGFTYDLSTGQLAAVLTDSPDSPISGKANVAVKTYPVEERANLIWVYVGDHDPPSVETDIPSELLRPDATICGKVSVQEGNWRLAAEAGIDEGHARFLHRESLYYLFREFPIWTRFGMEHLDDGWLIRNVEEVIWADEYAGLGRWPRKPAPVYKSKGRGARQVGIRLPGVVRVQFANWTSYEYYVPIDEDHRLEILLAVTWTGNWLRKASFRARYFSYIGPLFHGQGFHGQDNWMIENMTIPPERLYRPDKSVTSWRKLVEKEARDGAEVSPDRDV